MLPKHVMDKIKSMITKEPSLVKEVDYKVSNYQEVVKYWTDYKKNPDNVNPPCKLIENNLDGAFCQIAICQLK